MVNFLKIDTNYKLIIPQPHQRWWLKGPPPPQLALVFKDGILHCKFCQVKRKLIVPTIVSCASALEMEYASGR